MGVGFGWGGALRNNCEEYKRNIIQEKREDKWTRMSRRPERQEREVVEFRIPGKGETEGDFGSKFFAPRTRNRELREKLNGNSKDYLIIISQFGYYSMLQGEPA